jgi:hypothetical protein
LEYHMTVTHYTAKRNHSAHVQNMVFKTPLYGIIYA